MHLVFGFRLSFVWKDMPEAKKKINYENFILIEIKEIKYLW